MKKVAILGMAASIFVLGSSSVEATVDLPKTAAFLNYGDYKVIPGQNLLWGYYGYEDASLVDLGQGTRLQSLSETRDTYHETGFAVSDDQKMVAVAKNNRIYVYDAFAELIDTIEMIPYNNQEIKNFTKVEFLPGSHQVIALADEYEDGKLIRYDLDTKELLFVRGTSQFGDILVSDSNIAVINSDDIYLYGQDGTYQRVIHSTSGNAIEAYDFNRDGLLVVGEEGDRQLKVYDGSQNFKPLHRSGSFVTEMEYAFSDIDIDESGQFIATTYSGWESDFSLFERKTGRKIYTSLDADDTVAQNSPVALTKDAKSIVLRTEDNRSSVFSGKNISKRPVAISIIKDHQSVTSGASETLYLEVTQADGKKVKIKSGVKWATNAPTKAYIKSGKLYGKSVGTYTLKATYEGFTATTTGKVIAPPKLSTLKDEPWLKRHRQAIEATKSFEGKLAPGTSYKKVTGTAGSLFIPHTDAVWSGKWNGSVLYSRYAMSNSNVIDMLVLLPSLEKRSITKAEIKNAFGKAGNVINYSKPTTYHLDKSKKTFAKYSVKSAYMYQWNGQELYVAFDKNDYARFLVLSPSE